MPYFTDCNSFWSDITWNKKISRSKLLNTVRLFEPGTLIAMEACSTSYFWGRTFRTIGYSVRPAEAQKTAGDGKE
ncbi:hypothetical protein PEC302110_33020 [Pectobacterium araliae]|uniref:Uncharacterized protein n=1 Tax=Pectobacterium araliae TaxID=3073862 RepID=A0AAN0MMY7_9GAMM|nr:hypothetical protein PEC302110_33020 [Pectobacterium sp. MAFF 302110]